MSRSIFFILCFCIFFACTSIQKPKLTFCVEGAKDTAAISLQIKDTTYLIKLDSTHSATLDLNELQQPEYATLEYLGLHFPMYIEPDKDLDVLLKIDPKRMTSSQVIGYGVTPYFSGEGAAKNDYLNNRLFGQNSLDFKAAPGDFLAQLLNYEKELVAYLDSMKFDEKFVLSERNRIKIFAYRPLLFYPLQGHDQPFIDSFYEIMNAAIVEDEKLVHLPLYRYFIPKGIERVVKRGENSMTRLALLRRTLDYVQQKFTHASMQEYLIDLYLTDFMSSAGTGELAEFMPLYEQKVTSLEKKAKFYALCDTWKKIEPGHQSPTFAYSDINGEKVALEDFRGKYVYIDVWASWCGPCCGEIPHLKELEHRFKKKNIVFVSISCDKDKKAWVKMVKKEKLGGIQLHNGGDWTFMNAYMVKGIPRFILLDREGKIINSRMTRPSNPETAQFIETLEGL